MLSLKRPEPPGEFTGMGRQPVLFAPDWETRSGRILLVELIGRSGFVSGFAGSRLRRIPASMLRTGVPVRHTTELATACQIHFRLDVVLGHPDDRTSLLTVLTLLAQFRAVSSPTSNRMSSRRLLGKPWGEQLASSG